MIQRHLVTDWFNAFNDLSTGKLDAIIVDRWVGEYQLTQMSLSNVKALEPALSISESRIAVARDRPDLLAAINHGLAEISTNGSRETIEQHWKGQEVVYFSRDQLRHQRILLLTAALAILLLLTVLYIFRQNRSSKRLSDLNDALLQSNQELNEFARVASHDLQEPLRQLLLRLELFELEHDESPTKQGSIYQRPKALRFECSIGLPPYCTTHALTAKHSTRNPPTFTSYSKRIGSASLTKQRPDYSYPIEFPIGMSTRTYSIAWFRIS